jgi:hypothetical protein
MPFRPGRVPVAALALALCCGASAAAQNAAPTNFAALASFPDAPSARLPGAETGQAHAVPPASPYDKYIEPDQEAPTLNFHDKAILGIRDAFSFTSIVVWPIVAGYEQLRNDSPNWPQNKAGFFRRAGAAGVRDSTSGMFGDSVFAPLFHQDPRYYRQGPRHNVAYRTFYAISRPLITRTDGGHAAPNFSLLAGDLCGALGTNIYYPTANQGVTQTAMTFGGSVGSSALGYFVAEFGEDVLEALHLKHPH